MNYKQLVDGVMELLADHEMVKEVIYAPDWKINEQAKPGREYFLAVVSPVTSNPLDNTTNRALRITVMDVISQRFDNRLQIQSDCEGILIDFIKYVKLNDLEFNIIPDPSITIFEEQWADNCAGAFLDIIFETDAEDSCNIPFN